MFRNSSVLYLYLGLSFAPSTPSLACGLDIGGVMQGMKRFVTVAFIAYGLQGRRAEAGTPFFATFGGSNTDIVNSVQVKPNGNIGAFGYTQSFGSQAEAVYTEYTGSGAWQVSRKFGGSGNEYGEAFTLQGYDMIFTGRTDTYGDGNADLFISRFNATDLLFFNTLGETAFDGAYDITSTTDGGWVIVGSSLQSITSYDIIIAKFTSNGVLQWLNTLQGSSTDLGRGVVETTDGGLVIVGYSRQPTSSNDIIIAKYNAVGTLQWKRFLGGSSNDYGRAVAATPDGGVIVVGYTTSFGSSSRILYAKIASGGSLVFAKAIEGSGSDQGTDVAVKSDGTFAIAGALDRNLTGIDALLAVFSSSGSVTFAKVLEGSEIGFANAVAIADNGDYIIGGATNTYSGTSFYDGFVARLRGNGAIDCGTLILLVSTDITSSVTYVSATTLTSASKLDLEASQSITQSFITPISILHCSETSTTTQDPSPAPNISPTEPPPPTEPPSQAPTFNTTYTTTAFNLTSNITSNATSAAVNVTSTMTSMFTMSPTSQPIELATTEVEGDKDDSGLSTGEWAAIISGSSVVLILTTVGGFLLYKKKKGFGNRLASTKSIDNIQMEGRITHYV